VAQGNNVNGRPLTLLDSDIEMGTWNSSTGQFNVLTGSAEYTATAVRVTGRLRTDRGTQVRLSFLPLIGGGDAVQPTARSVGEGGMGSVDLLIVQDVSQSFQEELADAKTGNLALLSALNTPGTRSNLGLVAFSGWGRTISSFKTISSNYSSLSNSINSLKLAGNTGMPPVSGTDIASGIEEALVIFGSHTSIPGATKVILLVSDGTPTRNSSGKHPTLNDTQLLSLAQSDADTAWSRGIHVYVVFFDRTNDTNAATRLRTLIRGSGTFVRTSDPAQLPAAIGSITRQLPGQIVK
jgi:hypothetical protein